MRPVTGDFNHKNPLDWFLVKRAAVVPAFRPGTLDRFKKVSRRDQHPGRDCRDYHVPRLT